MEREELIERFARYMLSEVAEESAERSGKLKGYEKPYLFTNECLDVLLRRLKPQGKRVLTTGSSGDQAIYAIANGAKSVTIFDLCPFAKVYTDYKIALFKTFSFEQMQQIILTKKEMFAPSTYNKIRQNLSNDSKEFWDMAFLEGFDYNLMPISERKDSPMEKATYLNSLQEFEKIKNALMGEYSIDFINTHLQDLPKELVEGEQYDFILLSNIVKFVDRWDGGREKGYKSFWDTVETLSKKHLTKGGVMQIDYRYFDLLQSYRAYVDRFGKGKIGTSGVNYATGAILYRPTEEDQINA